MHKSTSERRKADRIKAILLLNKGFDFNEVAELLLIDDATVRRWYDTFKTKGIKTLIRDFYIGGTRKLTQIELTCLNQQLSHRIYRTAKEVCWYVEQKFGVVYTPKGMTSLLHKLGFRYKKPKQVPGKANLEKQQAFIEQYEALKQGKSPEDHVYFMDGVHPLHNSQMAYGWIKKGKEKTIKSNTGRERLNLNGAYDIDKHKMFIQEDESVNSQSTIALIKQIQAKQQKGKIFIILDNAKYYKSELIAKFLDKNPRVQFMFLPPYSPNLNIIERLWKFFKENITYNKYYGKFKVFREKSLHFFENIQIYREELKSLMTENFHLFPA